MYDNSLINNSLDCKIKLRTNNMPTIKVKGMSCQHCVASVTKALSEIEGITDVQVNLEKGEATFSEQSPVAEQTIKDAIARIGFEVVS